MGRGAKEQSAIMDVDLLKGFHHEMAYALDFVSDALKSKADTFCSFIEDIVNLIWKMLRTKFCQTL